VALLRGTSLITPGVAGYGGPGRHQRAELQADRGQARAPRRVALRKQVSCSSSRPAPAGMEPTRMSRTRSTSP
jgi:hypothetical protein